MTIPSTKSYAAGHFELLIDGHKTTTYLKAVEGGWAKANVIDEPIGADPNRVKHLGTVELDPISLEFGLSGSRQLLEWMQGSFNRKWSRRNGQISHADFNLNETFEHWFYDALITEASFPTLDGSSKDSGYLKCKIQPERVLTKPGPPKSISGQYTITQKQWVPSSFRFTIDRLDAMKYTNKIDGFTIKQGIKRLYTGADRFPQIEPTSIQFPNLTGTIALAYADDLLKWHSDYVFKGTVDPRSQLTGSIEYLTADRTNTIFRINLFEIGLMSAMVEPSTANSDSIKRVKFEMFVGRMEIDGPGSLGLD
jgi:hypothetical protein